MNLDVINEIKSMINLKTDSKICNDSKFIIVYTIYFGRANSMKYVYYVLINDRYIMVFHYLNKLDPAFCILFHAHNPKVMRKLR